MKSEIFLKQMKIKTHHINTYGDAAKTVLRGKFINTFIKKDLKCYLFFMLTFRLEKFSM